MEKIINDIISAAKSRGACALTKTATDFASLARLLFSPQGKEFCQLNRFPTLAMLRGCAGFDVRQYGVYVDTGRVTLHNAVNVAVAGDTQAELSYSGVEHKYCVMVMHGAQASISASGHAVIEVINIGGDVSYDTDETVVLL